MHRPPPPSATFVRRLRAGGAGLVALLVWAVAAPGFLPGDALAAGRAPVVAGIAPGSEPSAAEVTAASRKLRSSLRFLALTVTVSPRWPHE